MGPGVYFSTEELKEIRKTIDGTIQIITAEGTTDESPKNFELYHMASYQVMTKLTEAKMWIGKMLEAKGHELPKEFQDKHDAAV